MNKKSYDSWLCHLSNEDDFLTEISLQESESTWKPDIPSNALRLEAIESPLMAEEAVINYGLDDDLTSETQEQGTQLILCDGQSHYLVRDTARSTMGETAKLYGSALGRMSLPIFCETMNNGFEVAKGNSLFLIRRGKLSAIHSNADSGYLVMDQERLVTIATGNLEDTFGEIEFKSGEITHALTSCLWTLPDAQSDILDAYRNAIKNACSQNYAINMMPAVRFTTSDTASSAARLTPIFLMGSTEVSLIPGVEVRHSKKMKNGLNGIDLWTQETGDMFAQFQRSMEQVEALASTSISNGTNCVVSLCKHFGIPKKYGDRARETVERLTVGGRKISAHDVYLSMYSAVESARSNNASPTTIIALQETIAKIAMADWSSHDVGGIVSW